jgi:myo-inositol 2-dehydrogenase/D-chiro-inositol 1-dehydrogenase
MQGSLGSKLSGSHGSLGGSKADLVKELSIAKLNELASPGEDEKVYGVALVGLGRSGHFHLTSIRSLPGATRLKWAVDVNETVAKKVAKDFACKWSTDLKEALEDKAVDIVIIASTTDTHFPFIMQSLEAKKAVFAEKPISHTVSEVQTAVDYAKEHKLQFVCGYQRRCDGNFRAMKEQIVSGSVGKIKVVKSCSRDNPLPPIEYLRTSGGIFQDMLIHDFDMQDWILQGAAPESIIAMGHAYHPEIQAMDDLDNVAVMMKYADGTVAMIDTCRDASYGYDQRVEVFGDKGMLTAGNEKTSTVELATGAGHLMPPAQWSFPQRYKHAYMTELAEFIALLHAGKDSEAYRLEEKEMMRHPRIVRTALAAELSWRLGRQVKLSEDLEKLAEQVMPAHH